MENNIVYNIIIKINSSGRILETYLSNGTMRKFIYLKNSNQGINKLLYMLSVLLLKINSML